VLADLGDAVDQLGQLLAQRRGTSSRVAPVSSSTSWSSAIETQVASKPRSASSQATASGWVR
jgi:hypothetical protein